ncbi:MAG TPA: hypothetical protein DIT65_00590 [Cryomorphaceae bacterium]|nr:hypothetical protein [Cryomorphaceae bacterium]|tara:strand:+ start:877 stop:2082 length:1206 start_codon:yes stop_codon:yes gene_type:complete
MIVYPILSNIVFGLWRSFAKEDSWVANVQRDNGWKQCTPLAGKVVWMHCASLGEFEMGRPVLEQFLDSEPSWKAVVTFFSPSGYEPRKNYQGAQVHYLPIDTPSEVKKWLSYCNPALALFVRYDLWPNHAAGLRRRGVPTVIMAMSASKVPWYLKRTIPLIRKTFQHAVMTWGMISDKDAAVMSIAGIHSEVLGNPKYDYAAGLVEVEANTKFKTWKQAQQKPILLVGSAHATDCIALNGVDLSSYSIWIVPHEINKSGALSKTLKRYNPGQVLESTVDEPTATDVLLVPEFGVLTGLYSLADGVLIGGGWEKATHNVLEATAQGKVAACGPNWKKIAENHELVSNGYLFPIESNADFIQYLARVGTEELANTGKQAQMWMLDQRGAAKKIVKVLEKAVQL